jgi:hypothetical protein
VVGAPGIGQLNDEGSPRCCREIPAKQGWDRAARAHGSFGTHA